MLPKSNGTIVAVLMTAMFFVTGCGEETTATHMSDSRLFTEHDQGSARQSVDNTSSPPIPTTKTDEPIELGKVQWGRDIELAKNQSAESGKPVLVLFQEVPG